VVDATGISPEEWTLWRAFLRSHARVSREIDLQLQRDAGLAQGEYATISAILESPRRRLRIGEIAEALGWEKSRVSHLIGRMEQRSLVAREACADDARAVEIVVTPEGRRKQLAAVRAHAAEVRRVFLDHVSPDEREVMTRVLRRVIDELGSTGQR
jgi:DNA-binding MarR family transcriptional regulator